MSVPEVAIGQQFTYLTRLDRRRRGPFTRIERPEQFDGQYRHRSNLIWFLDGGDIDPGRAVYLDPSRNEVEPIPPAGAPTESPQETLSAMTEAIRSEAYAQGDQDGWARGYTQGVEAAEKALTGILTPLRRGDKGSEG